MRIMAIDYGSKRVGIALTDETNTFALPKSVYPNDETLLETVVLFIRHNDVGEVVIGESKDFNGKDNKIMKEARAFKARLEEKTKLPVHWEAEFMTSEEAMRGNPRRSDTTEGRAGTRKEKDTNEMLDASAAAIILKSYLDKKKQSQYTNEHQ